MTSILDRLGLNEWASNQLNPHIPVNTFGALGLVLKTAAKGKDTDTPPGSPAEGDYYIVGSTPTGAWSTFTSKNLAVYHNGGWVQVTRIDLLVVPVDDGAGGITLWRYDTGGADWNEIQLGPGAIPYDVPIIKGDTPTSSEVIGRYTLARDIDFLANFSGSVGTVETNPTATFDIDVRDDGASIGTISVSTGGAFTFTTTSGTAKTVASGSKFEFVAPSSADATIAGISLMLRGTTVDL